MYLPTLLLLTELNPPTNEREKQNNRKLYFRWSGEKGKILVESLPTMVQEQGEENW
jgi:hypothetical protein